MKTSISDNGVYPNFCKIAVSDEMTFKYFRSNDNYTSILEHVKFEEGKVYLDIVSNTNPELLENIEKYKTSENVGNPKTFLYDSIGRVSPTTLRYIKVLSDLKQNFGDLTGMDIVEIGCGYGGQSKIITDTFSVKSYTLIDLPETLELAKKFLTRVGVNIESFTFKTMDQLEDRKYDLAISNYALTECKKDIQTEYLNKVVLNSKKGYITANFVNDCFNLDFLTKDEWIDSIPSSFIVDEGPQTHKDNIVILWK